MTQQVKTYQERSREYLAKAFEELEAGDLTQASEKGWGAAAQIVQAAANSGYVLVKNEDDWVVGILSYTEVIKELIR